MPENVLGRSPNGNPALEAITSNQILTVAMQLEGLASYFSIFQKVQEENNHICNQNKTRLTVYRRLITFWNGNSGYSKV